MMERWLRRDATAGVEVYPGILPPALDEMLNRDATSLRDPITLPIAPGERLIGSSYVHEPDGDLVSVMYDIDGDIGTIAQAITDQMNKAPWTVFGGDGEEALRTVQFGNTQVAGVQGRAIIELNPNPQDYRLTVSRDGRWLYVGDMVGGAVSVVEVARARVVQRIPVAESVGTLLVLPFTH